MASICLHTSEFDLDTVCEILSSSIKLNTYDVWRKFCKSLENEDFRPTKCEYSEDNGFYFALDELLTIWAAIKQEGSTLNALLDILDNCELWEESDKLRDTFSLSPKHPNLPVLSMSVEVLEQLGDHVSNNCSTLCHSTKITTSLLDYLEESCSHGLPHRLRNMKIDSIGLSSKCLRFYSALRKNPKCLQCVIEALEKDEQFKPGWTLRRVYRKFDTIETVFKRIATNPNDVDKIINSAFTSDSSKGNKFSKTFSTLFPQFGYFSPAIKSFLRILSSFKFIDSDTKEITVVHEIYQALGITYSEMDGIFQFWVYLVKIYMIVRNKYSHKKPFMIFNFMNAFPIEQTRVVILGQHPSPFGTQSGFAYHGCSSKSNEIILSFLNFELKIVDENSTMKHKLEIPSEVLDEYMKNLLLDGWVQQGVLMFNAWLTYREKIWSVFTDFFIKYLSTNGNNIVFIMTGRKAEEKIPLIDHEKHAVFNVYLTNKPRERQWNVNLPLINTNFYLYQISKNISSMIDWCQVKSFDQRDDRSRDEQLEKLSKYKEFFDELLKRPTQGSTKNVKYFVKCIDSHDNQNTTGKKLRIETLPTSVVLTKHRKGRQSLS